MTDNNDYVNDQEQVISTQIINNNTDNRIKKTERLKVKSDKSDKIYRRIIE